MLHCHPHVGHQYNPYHPAPDNAKGWTSLSYLLFYPEDTNLPPFFGKYTTDETRLPKIARNKSLSKRLNSCKIYNRPEHSSVEHVSFR